jgi:3-hydroxyacyl-CoA dehydrogenase/enoyl-CoA hydratase/3-hydroxybutyryl-CoA epimerase
MNMMNMMQTYEHWRLEIDTNQKVWAYFDKKNSSINTIDKAVMEEFSHIIDFLSTHTMYKGLFILSGKKNGFIAGADISQFTQFKNIEESAFVLTEGQHILNRLESLTIPTVAIIDGFLFRRRFRISSSLSLPYSGRK